MEVRRRGVFAFRGSNGAGKTTTVGVLEGYLKRIGGEVSVRGVDSEGAGPEGRGRVGVVLQEWAMEPDLTVRECLRMYSGYYGWPRSVEELIELVGLAEQADALGGSLSGGQRRRLDVGLALVGDSDLTWCSWMSRRSVLTRQGGVAVSGEVGRGGGAVAEREFWSDALGACD
jgi:ABC-2 type transport system ATP-binding protein